MATGWITSFSFSPDCYIWNAIPSRLMSSWEFPSHLPLVICLFCSFLFHYNWELSLSRSLFPLFQMYPYWACPVRWCHGYWDLDYLAAALEMWGNKTKDYVTVSTLDEYYRDLHINTNWFTSIVSVCLYWQGQRGAYSWVVTACTAFHMPIKLHLNRVRNPPPFQGVLLFAMLHDNDFIAVGQ